MRKKVSLGAFAIIGLLWVSMGMMALAANKGTCSHSNAREQRTIEGPWSVAHTITISQAQGPVTCTVMIWKERVYYFCPDCGHNMLWDTFTHEKHNICGINY